MNLRGGWLTTLVLVLAALLLVVLLIKNVDVSID